VVDIHGLTSAASRNLFEASRRFITNIPPSVVWRKTGRTYTLFSRKGQPFIFFVIGHIEASFLADQGLYSQYTIRIRLDNNSCQSFTRILESCPDIGDTSPLNGDILKASVSYHKVFNPKERESHNGAFIAYPYVRNAVPMNGTDSLGSLPLFSATDLTNGSLVALAVTLSSYQLKFAHGISARLSHVYLIELAPGDRSYDDVVDLTLEDDESD